MVKELVQPLSSMGLKLERRQLDMLLRYHQLMYKWNKIYNLTAIPESDGVLRHLIDSLSVHTSISELFVDNHVRLMDAGTGAGLPGIPLAIAFPALHFICVDAVEKKIRFLEQVRTELALSNVSCIHGRLERLRIAPVDGVICRAFAATEDFLQLCSPLVRKNGWLLNMQSERIECYDGQAQGCKLFHVKPLWAPAGVRARNLLVYQKHES